MKVAVVEEWRADLKVAVVEEWRADLLVAKVEEWRADSAYFADAAWHIYIGLPQMWHV